MGYRHAYGPDVDRDFRSPLYEDELTAALYRLNPTMPEDAIADALYKLKNFENAELVRKNAVFMDYIQHGVEVRYFLKGEERFMEWKTKDGSYENTQYAQFDPSNK